MIDASSFKRKDINEKKESFLKKILFSTLVKTLVVMIIFLSSSIYIKQSDINKHKFENLVYNNDISFAKIYNLYQKYLGDVIPFKNIFKENKRLVGNEIISYNNITKENNGYIIDVSKNYSVISINDGVVVKITKDKNYKTLVTIQNKEGVNITYGLVYDINVKLYDYIKKSEIIGIANEKLYVSFEKNGKYLTYEKYL